MTDKEDRQEGIKGAVEGLKGKVKETAGTFLGNDSAQREGRAQQEKADAQQRVSEKEAEADRAREEAALGEARQRREQ
ncbi:MULTISPECIES: CsbD family protein [Amycolatopsis]|uniref:microaggregate-binding protein 1 n=1 Tax=Amycolatopsis TaxID=1813 RepID=UPI000B8B0F8E|nr:MULTISPECIES: CsbD family protein [Amycolatopsis]OXM74561.1 CsbD family protein [Amycolatopsis sp. KNN50.9b]